MKTKSFVYGQQDFPEWFKIYCVKGVARETYNEDTEEKEMSIYGVGTTYTAKKGDTIVLSNAGLSVVKKVVKPKKLDEE